jgi:hypothetical protein
MNFELHVEGLLSWYCSLARSPNWKEYVWHRVNELAKTHPMYEELPDRLVEQMKSEQSSLLKSPTDETCQKTPQPSSPKGSTNGPTRKAAKSV